MTAKPDPDRELARLLLAGLKEQGALWMQERGDGCEPLTNLLVDGWLSLTELAKFIREHRREP